MSEILTREEYEGLLETLDRATLDDPKGEEAGERLIAHDAALRAENEALRERAEKAEGVGLRVCRHCGAFADDRHFDEGICMADWTPRSCSDDRDEHSAVPWLCRAAKTPPPSEMCPTCHHRAHGEHICDRRMYLFGTDTETGRCGCYGCQTRAAIAKAEGKP